MKKTAKNVLGLFFCILMISMCTGTIPAFAASSGMIHIQLEDLDSDSSDKKGVSFELYCVGTVGDSGEPVFDTKYNITAYPKTAEETEQVIQQISTALDIDAQETAVTDGKRRGRFPRSGRWHILHQSSQCKRLRHSGASFGTSPVFQCRNRCRQSVRV